MRCLALAQAWQDAGGAATFAMAMDAPAVKARLEGEGMNVVSFPDAAGSHKDARRTIALARELGAQWVVVDGYHFGGDYQRTIKDVELSLLWIDDEAHADHYTADIVLNQNLHATEAMYAERELYTRLLLGPRYVLLRREFLKWRDWQRKIPPVARKILVTLGGGDPDNATLKVMEALKHIDLEGLQVVVLAGATNPHYAELEAAARDAPFPIRLESNVSDMPALMALSDVAISGGGSTCWEMAFMGLPNVILVLADNQRAIGEQLDARGVSVNLGEYVPLAAEGSACCVKNLLNDAVKREEMSQCGKELVDGDGTARVLILLQGTRMRLRKARHSDAKLLWDWANDPAVRKAAFSTDPIPWETHLQWFERKLNDPDCHIYIAVDERDTPVGQIRFDRWQQAEAVIDVSIDHSKRGSGYGSLLVETGMHQLFADASFLAVHGFVKIDNFASIQTFERAGFRKIGLECVNNTDAIHLIRATNDSEPRN